MWKEEIELELEEVFCYTGWPRKNVTTSIINFKYIVNKTDFFFYFIG